MWQPYGMSFKDVTALICHPPAPTQSQGPTYAAVIGRGRRRDSQAAQGKAHEVCLGPPMRKAGCGLSLPRAAPPPSSLCQAVPPPSSLPRDAPPRSSLCQAIRDKLLCGYQGGTRWYPGCRQVLSPAHPPGTWPRGALCPAPKQPVPSRPVPPPNSLCRASPPPSICHGYTYEVRTDRSMYSSVAVQCLWGTRVLRPTGQHTQAAGRRDVVETAAGSYEPFSERARHL